MREIVSLLHREDRAAVEAVRRVLPSVTRVAEAARDALAAGGRIVYVGAGTSGRLGALDAAECPPTFGTDPAQVVALIAGGPKALIHAVEGAEDDAAAGAREIRALRIGSRDLVIGISASATTPYVVGALKAARARGAKTALITAAARRGQAKTVDFLVAPKTGAELVAGSTRLKAGTATKLVLNAISTAAMVALGKVYRGRMVDLQVTNAKLRARAERMVAELTGLSLRRARRLLKAAGDSPKLALAMHFTGASAPVARRAVERHGLRGLERLRHGRGTTMGAAAVQKTVSALSSSRRRRQQPGPARR